MALLLYWPQQDLWAQTLLGGWLLPAWFVVWFAVFALLLSPSTSLLNLLLALAVAAAIAGLWYLPRAGFAVELSDVAFGTGGGDFEVADWSSFNQYFRYFRLFFQHHLGLALGLLILPAGLLPWLWRGRTWLHALPGTLLLWVTTLSPFLLLIATSQTNSRNLVPVLPLFAILVSIGLLAYPVPWRFGWAAGVAGRFEYVLGSVDLRRFKCAAYADEYAVAQPELLRRACQWLHCARLLDRARCAGRGRVRALPQVAN